MDCSNSPDGSLQPSLYKWYEAVDSFLGKVVDREPDLSYLTDQGVMLLNTALTCRLGETGSHCKLWRPFQEYFLQVVMKGREIPIVFAGKESEKLLKYISPGTPYCLVEHPAAAARERRKWLAGYVFNWIKDRTSPIDWDPGNACPFKI